MAQNSPSVWIGFIVFGETTAAYLPSFLDSLASACNCRLIAFDNSPEAQNANGPVLARYPEVLVMREGGNIGFSAAYNRMLRAAQEGAADYFLVINPDTIVERDALERLVSALEADTSLGSVAPKLLRFDFSTGERTKIIDSAGLALRPGLRFVDRGQGEADSGQYDARRDILGPSGAAGLFRMPALEKIKEGNDYYDEHFFMYKEDCDLAYRLKLAGFGSEAVSEALVYHDRTAWGDSLWNRFFNRRSRSRAVNAWAFTNQHLLWIKYWTRQSVMNKAIIIFQRAARFAAACILEPQLLRCYRNIGAAAKTLKRY